MTVLDRTKLWIDISRVPKLRRRASRPRLVAALALGAMVVLVADVVVVLDANQARPVSLSTALRKFRSSTYDSTSGAAPVAGAAVGTGAAATIMNPTTGAIVGPTGTGAEPATGAVTRATSGGASSAVRSSAVGQSSAPTAVVQMGSGSAGPPFALPPAGVYAYRTDGGEQLNVPGSSRTYPSITYATLTYKGGCEWELENDVIQQHTDRRWSCSQPGSVTQVGQGRTVSYYGQTEGFDYWCSPPLTEVTARDAANTAHDGVCKDTSGDAAAVHLVNLGKQQVLVGGTQLTVWHLLLTSTLTGSKTGSARDELLLDARTGMTISWHRSVDTWASGAFGMNAHYQEHCNFDLISLRPQT